MIAAAALLIVPLITTGAPQPPVTIETSASVVRVDVVVTGRNGQPVLDLQPSDFEVREEGRPQKITHFLVIGPAASVGVATSPMLEAGAAAPGASGQRQQAGPAPAERASAPVQPALPSGRRLVFLIDDLSLSSESLNVARPVLSEVIARLAPDDCASILTTSAPPARLTMTADTAALQRAVLDLRWNVRSGRMKSVDPIEVGLQEQILGDAGLGYGKPGAALEQQRDGARVRGTLDLLHALVGGLAALPGRKAVVLLSDSLKLTPAGRDRFDSLGESANRATVSVYSLDARGLQPLSMAADDYVTVPGASNVIRGELDVRTREHEASQSGLRELAQQTGGLFFGGSLRRALEGVITDTGLYYVLGYSPQEGGARGRRLRRIEVKLGRPGCRVRARRLYYG